MAYNRVTYIKNSCTVSIPFARTRVAETPVMAADGITQEATRYNFDFSGVASASTTQDFQLLLWKMRNVLSKPRGSLTVEWSDDNVTWYSYYTFEENQDINWGPKPGVCNISEFIGGLAAMYSWSIEVTTKECFASCSSTPNGTENILSLTRHSSFTVDQNGFTTRDTTGKLVVTSGAVKRQRGPDFYRNFCVPPVPTGYQRQSQRFSESADKLSMDFAVTDKEVQWTLPRPITSGNASYMVAQEGVGGLVTYAISGRFEAPANVSKNVILQKVGDLLQSRVPPGLVIWQNRRITEDVYGNAIAFDLSWRGAGMTGDGTYIADYSKIGLTPPGNDGVAAIAGAYGGDGTESDSGVIADPVPSPLYDACIPGPLLATVGGSSNGTPATTGPNIVRDPPPNSPGTVGTTSGLTFEMIAAPYVAYHERVSWEIDNHIVAFPSKSSGADPVVQKTAATTVTVVQAGYSVRYGPLDLPPTAPPPMYTLTTPVQGRLVSGSPEYSNPEILGVAGQYSQKVSWAYRIQLLKTPPNMVALDIHQPGDPRTIATAFATIPGPPVASPNLIDVAP